MVKQFQFWKHYYLFQTDLKYYLPIETCRRYRNLASITSHWPYIYLHIFYCGLLLKVNFVSERLCLGLGSETELSLYSPFGVFFLLVPVLVNVGFSREFSGFSEFLSIDMTYLLHSFRSPWSLLVTNVTWRMSELLAKTRDRIWLAISTVHS